MNKPFLPPSTPWSAARGGLAPSPIPGLDPRLEVSDEALIVASQNAYPVIAKHKMRSDRSGLLAGAAVALVLGAITFASMNWGRTQRASSATALVPAQVTQAPTARPFPLQPGVAMPLPSMSMNHPQPEMVSVPMPTTGPTPIAGAANGSSPAVVFDTSIGPASETGGRPSPVADPETPALLAGASGAQVAGGGEASSARSNAMADPANTIVEGTLIPAVLETAIYSELPGYARAVISQDVRSFDGSKILVPRSSRLIGEYKAGTNAGQTRVYLMWTRLVRPDGVSIALASPAVDAAGQAGVGGKVHDHFLQRFGSAILLSLISSAGALGSGGATVVMSGGGQSAASVAAERDGQRLPTINVRQGEPIRVFTARDLIFASAEASKG